MCAGGNLIMCYWYMHVLVVDVTNRACHGSASADDAAREKEFFFSSVGVNRQNTATFNDCTCAVIKPHAVIDGSYAVSFSQSVSQSDASLITDIFSIQIFDGVTYRFRASWQHYW